MKFIAVEIFTIRNSCFRMIEITSWLVSKLLADANIEIFSQARKLLIFLSLTPAFGGNFDTGLWPVNSISHRLNFNLPQGEF